jgi:hypothetical protein
VSTRGDWYRRMRSVCVLAGVALAIVAVSMDSGGAAVAVGPHYGAGARAASVRTCQTSQLKVKVVFSAVAAGTAGGYIGFTNRASAPCRLTGWPKFVALTRAGASTTALHVRSTMFGPRPTIKGAPVVTLRHGERADAGFTGGDNPGPGKTTCPPPYRHLRVTPPGNSRSVLISAWLPSYGHYLPACTQIEVSMIVPGSALYRG